jgi:hypothetical protein
MESQTPFLIPIVGAIVGFELKASHLLGRHFSTWAMSPTLFALGYFPDSLPLFPQADLELWSSCRWGYKYVPPFPAFFVKMESHKLFPQTGLKLWSFWFLPPW